MDSGPSRARAQRGPPVELSVGDRRGAWSVLLLLLAVYSATFCGLPDVPDAEVEFQTASALARTGSFALAGTPEADAIAATGFGVAPGSASRAGELYSRYGVGQALAALPFYLAGKTLETLLPQIEARHAASEAYGFPRSEYFAHLLVGWRNPLLGALTGLLLVLTARRLGASARSAWWCGLSYGLCTFAWPQARSTLSDVQATFLLFAAFHWIVKARETTERTGLPAIWTLAGAGAALGGALLTRVAALPVVLVLACVGCAASSSRAWRTRGSERREHAASHLRPRFEVLAVLVPLALSAGILLALNHARFGNALHTGYGSAGDAAGFFRANPIAGFFGLLVSPGKGLAWMAPGLLLVPLGLLRAARAGDRLWPWTLAGIALASLIPTAFLRGWHGAWTYGPRYVLPLLPFAWLGVAFALDAARERRWVKPLGAALLALGFAVALGGALVDHTTHTDLGLQAARAEWPDAPAVPEAEQEERRFERMQWDWRFAAPWAHWRILRQRAAGRGESFFARSLYFVDSAAPLAVAHERERGFRHLAWVDLAERLRGPRWPGFALCGLLAGLGIALGFRGREPDPD
jgi:hypothetical protein